MMPASASVPVSQSRNIDREYPPSPIAAIRRRPQVLDALPQNGEVIDQSSADSENTAPAIQSGIAISRVSCGSTAASSIVLPAPIAINAKKSRMNALRLSGLG